ncbi:odorant receptor 43a-like [Schistocerca gregaria]|uniref:odorant receptor 43a-like n=1 Tax=Schistocerca gregaria TaxID=7010 RepID=UPI00211E5B1B|nr:odorant receptor 43a-like [Schistocerca gregaria]
MDSDTQGSKSLTWQYTVDSILKYDVRFLSVCGLWPLQGSRLFRIFTVTIITLCLGHICEAGINLCTLRGELEDYTLALSNVSVIIVGVLKVAIFLRDEGSLCRLVRWLDALVKRQTEYVRGQPCREAIFREARQRASRISKGLDAYNVSLLFVWILAPLLASPGDKRLPLQQLPTANTTAFPLYELSYALQGISLTFIALINVHMDCFFTVVMIHIAAQLKIMASRIADLHLTRNGGGNSLTESKLGKNSLVMEDLYKKLCLCIHTHQDITRFIVHLEKVMNPIAMMQLALGVFNGCMLIFPAAYSAESESLLKILVSAPVVSTQLLLYCLGAHSVREQGELVSLAAYSCGWPDADARFRKASLLVMVRAQRALRLTAGGIYPIQRATFLSLLNAGYSYYAVLQNFTGR